MDFNQDIMTVSVQNNYNDSVDILWNKVSGLQTIKVTEYTAFKCVNTPSYGYVLVSSPKFTLGQDQSICEGTSVVFNPDTGFLTYHWNTGGTANCLTGIAAGTYSITVTDNGGCTQTGVYPLTDPSSIVISTGFTQPSCFGGSNGTAQTGKRCHVKSGAASTSKHEQRQNKRFKRHLRILAPGPVEVPQSLRHRAASNGKLSREIDRDRCEASPAAYWALMLSTGRVQDF